jgi:uncharacterized protein (DUF2236 family)
VALRLRDISNEAILLAGGARAILLQVALPSVGHGVAEHSDFTADPLRRLRNTLTYLYVIVYGTADEVARVTDYVDRAHGPVHSADGASPAYDAFDPEQQLWVAATLYDSAMTVYTAILGAPAPDDAESLYAEYAILGTALQMPPELWPGDRAAFAGYWRRTHAPRRRARPALPGARAAVGARRHAARPAAHRRLSRCGIARCVRPAVECSSPTAVRPHGARAGRGVPAPPPCPAALAGPPLPRAIPVGSRPPLTDGERMLRP